MKSAAIAPSKVKRAHLRALALGGGVTAALFSTDRATSDALTAERDGDLKDVSEDIEGIVSPTTMTAAAAGIYLVGLVKGSGYERETGLLALRATLDGNIIITPIRMLAGRERPFVSESGRLNFDGPTTDDDMQSFVSRHAVTSWALAAVLARRYPERKWITYSVYPLAASVSFFRVTAKEHFLSDMFVGGVLGYVVGRHSVADAQGTSPGARTIVIAPSIYPGGGGFRATVRF